MKTSTIRSATIYYPEKSDSKRHLLDYLLEALALHYAAYFKGMSALEAGAETRFLGLGLCQDL
jgi:hypothetical protein